jgi:hypothetical protein
LDTLDIQPINADGDFPGGGEGLAAEGELAGLGGNGYFDATQLKVRYFVGQGNLTAQYLLRDVT